MKSIVLMAAVMLLLGWFSSAVAQESRAVSTTKSAMPAQVAIPASKSHPGDISARPDQQHSAACCLKQCAGGGTCGTKCEVVDKLSACASNFSFECPANKGLTCVGGSCSCQ